MSCILSNTGARWANGVVPFVINTTDFPGGTPNHQAIVAAIAHWNSHTRFRFVARGSEHDYVEFTTAASSCSSAIGRIGGRQTIGCALGSGFDQGSIIHEMGHSVGLFHEQSREDRNFFVTVHYDNVMPSKRGNFDQAIALSDDGGPYDYGSIMHYGNRGFAIDPTKDTISAPQPIGQRNALSRFDIAGANSMLLQKTVLGDTSTSGPALITFQNRLVMAWRGVGNNQLNVIQSADGHHWVFKVTLGDTTRSAPALGVIGNRLALAWRGVGNNQLNILGSHNAVNWQSKITLADTSLDAPVLTSLGDRAVWGWTGTDSSHHLNCMLPPA